MFPSAVSKPNDSFPMQVFACLGFQMHLPPKGAGAGELPNPNAGAGAGEPNPAVDPKPVAGAGAGCPNVDVPPPNNPKTMARDDDEG